MIGTGLYTDFHFEKIIGKFNGWELNILSGIKVGSNILDLKNKKVNQHILNVVDDFGKAKEILESHANESIEVEVKAPDGVVIVGDVHKVDKLLQKNYNRGLWESRRNNSQTSYE